MSRAPGRQDQERQQQDRHGKFIAVANMKGGVGKTTTVVSLAEALAADDETKKVLVIDLDPQASASVAIAGDDILDGLIDADRTFEAFLDKRLITRDRIRIDDLIHRTISGVTYGGRQLDVALLPCGPRLRAVERDLIYELAVARHSHTATDGKITKLFRDDILPLAAMFDYILFDCAPGISPVTEIAIRLSDFVIVPTVPDRLSVYGLNAFYEGIWRDGHAGLPKPKARPHVLVVRMDGRIRQHQEVMDALRHGTAKASADYAMFNHQIKTSAALVEALMKGDDSTFTQKYTQAVISDILTPLVRELKERL